MTPIESAVYRDLVPSEVVVFELREPGDPALLMPEEFTHVRRAVPKRVGEFAAGRLCARRALAHFGVVDFPLRAAVDRQPLWPDTLIGSITHTNGFCAAAVTRRGAAAGLGIDSEEVAPLSAAVCARITVPEEAAWLAGLPAAEREPAAVLIFSAKEAFYKAQYPLAGSLGFQDVRVEPQWRSTVQSAAAPAASFVIRVTRDMGLAAHVRLPAVGHFRFHDNYVSTAVLLREARTSA